MKFRETGLERDFVDCDSEIATDSEEDCFSRRSRLLRLEFYASSSISLASLSSSAKYTPGECGINRNLLFPAKLVTRLPSFVVIFFSAVMFTHSSRLLKSVSRRQFSHENSSNWFPLTFDMANCLESPKTSGCVLLTARHVASLSLEVIWLDNFEASTYSFSF